MWFIDLWSLDGRPDVTYTSRVSFKMEANWLHALTVKTIGVRVHRSTNVLCNEEIPDNVSIATPKQGPFGDTVLTWWFFKNLSEISLWLNKQAFFQNGLEWLITARPKTGFRRATTLGFWWDQANWAILKGPHTDKKASSKKWWEGTGLLSYLFWKLRFRERQTERGNFYINDSWPDKSIVVQCWSCI